MSKKRFISEGEISKAGFELRKPLEHGFTAEDVNAILRSCREHRVDRLKIGTFSVSFLPRKPKAQEAATPTPQEKQAAKDYQNMVFLENEKRIRLENLGNLRLSDPEQYEELMSRGELEDAGQESHGTIAG